MEPSLNDAYRQLLPKVRVLESENKALKAALAVAHEELESLKALRIPKPKTRVAPSVVVEEESAE